ncbi:MAG: TonB-dependent siderophore receptor [Steroidobacteraceae bacterium]
MNRPNDPLNPKPGDCWALRMSVGGVAAVAAFSGSASAAQTQADTDDTTLVSVEVLGTAIKSTHDQPQSIDTIDKDKLTQQNITLLQEALRNVPGITLNSGEGGAHGDSINLRGLSIPDSFFLDGVRDIGQYQRDAFNSDAISVLLGPASAVFGRGSTAGVINSISKQPLSTPLAAVSVSGGQAEYWRGTGDFNLPLSDTIAARVAIMDQRNEVVDRDLVFYQRYGFAPSLSFGMGTSTRLTASYFREVENNLPDYGIPFIDGAPAHVDRSNYYGLVNYDRTRTNTNIGTLRFEHDLSDSLTLSDSLRYATYGFEYLVDGPFLGNDFVEPPPPGTPYSAIEVSRDQPSSGGATSMLINRTDLSSRLEVAGVRNTLTTGIEVSEEQSHVVRYQNGLDDVPPTPLVTPDPFHTLPTPLTVYSAPKGEGKDASIYVLDSVALGPRWDVDLGLRWDRFKTNFSEIFTQTAFERTDTFVSPRIAVVYKPSDAQSYYLSYGTSYNPTVEYLIIAPSNDSLSAEKNSALELGAKLKILDGKAQVTGALFDTFVKNVRNSDPDDPAVQNAPFDQRVKGVELELNGYLTEIFELTAGYTHLIDKITASSDPLSLDRLTPNTPHDTGNLWAILEPTPALSIGAGFSTISHRYADTENTAGVPGYVVFNAMASYQWNPHLKLQLNVNNITDKLYFTGMYYTGVDENHALPNPGRTAIGTVSYQF